MTDNTAKNKSSKTLRQAKALLIIGVLIIFVSPFLFTSNTFWSRLDFTQTGAIGDTIGGITAPIVNLLGAILVYLALTAQVEANQIVQRQLDEQKEKDNLQNKTDEINQLYYNLKESIDNFNYFSFESSEFGKEQYLTGSEAIYKLFNDFYCENCHLDDTLLKGNPKITELTSILEICYALLNKVEKSSVASKAVMTTLTQHQFRYRVFPYLNLLGGNYNKHYCNDCKKEHGLPDEMVQLITKLDNSTKINGG